ncbi:MAG: lactonase family protein [Acidobacteriota bacterium]|nr:lactonase family protein [Acidobacteriota bacterium]
MNSRPARNRWEKLGVVLLILMGGAASCTREEVKTMDQPESSGDLLVFFGTYTRTDSEGIYTYRMDPESGALERLSVVSGIESPSFLALHPNGRHLYAVSEIGEFEGGKTGTVSAYSIDSSSGQLSFLNLQPSQGAIPCHLVVDRTGRTLLLANYSGGSVASFPIDSEGRLGPAISVIQHEGSSVDPVRQTGPRAHSINLDPENRFAVAADLGTDEVLVYRFDAGTGELEPNTPTSVPVDPGGGPRHFAFHPSGRFGYVINEMGSTVTAFRYDGEKGTLDPIQTITTLPEGFEGVTHTAEVRVHPSGRFLYGSNRGHDSIAIFAIDQETGRLTARGQEPTRGKTPRNFEIDPTGTWLLAANQDSDSVVVFRIDSQTGALEANGQTADVPMPVCIRMLAR